MANNKLTRTREDAVIFGVCNGMAKSFNRDVTIIRLIFVALTLMGFSGILFYLIAALIMPLEETQNNSEDLYDEDDIFSKYD